MSIMTARFNRTRWSKTRIQIDAMSSGTELTFPASQYFNCKSSVERLGDAYGGERKYSMSGGKKSRITVKRIF